MIDFPREADMTPRRFIAVATSIALVVIGLFLWAGFSMAVPRQRGAAQGLS
jgi:hypothetical protein